MQVVLYHGRNMVVGSRCYVTYRQVIYLWTISSCSFTMCANCWKMVPNSTIVCSIFSIASDRLLIYESWQHETTAYFSAKVLRPTRHKQIIPETFFPANLLASAQEAKSNTIKANIHPEHKILQHKINKTTMWANAQRDGCTAEYRWRPLFNAVKFGWCPLQDCRAINAAKMRNLLKFAGVPQTPEPMSANSGPKFTILWGHVDEVLLLNNFFFSYRYVP